MWTDYLIIPIRGKCNFLQKALNAMKLNDLWSSKLFFLLRKAHFEYIELRSLRAQKRKEDLELST